MSVLVFSSKIHICPYFPAAAQRALGWRRKCPADRREPVAAAHDFADDKDNPGRCPVSFANYPLQLIQTGYSNPSKGFFYQSRSPIQDRCQPVTPIFRGSPVIPSCTHWLTIGRLMGPILR